MRARGSFDESGLQELKLWWEQFVEAVKMDPEVYRMLNFLGISIVVLHSWKNFSVSKSIGADYICNYSRCRSLDIT